MSNWGDCNSESLGLGLSVHTKPHNCQNMNNYSDLPKRQIKNGWANLVPYYWMGLFDIKQRVLIPPELERHMSSEENFRRLGLGIIMLEEKLEELKTYAQEMVRDKSKFDADVLINISNGLVSAAYELNQSYENYKSVRSTH
ncbi:MAG: hypothetical protein WBQ16_00515 [Nitrososphaeraceae archaeon]